MSFYKSLISAIKPRILHILFLSLYLTMENYLFSLHYIKNWNITLSLFYLQHSSTDPALDPTKPYYCVYEKSTLSLICSLLRQFIFILFTIENWLFRGYLNLVWQNISDFFSRGRHSIAYVHFCVAPPVLLSWRDHEVHKGNRVGKTFFFLFNVWNCRTNKLFTIWDPQTFCSWLRSPLKYKHDDSIWRDWFWNLQIVEIIVSALGLN